MSAAVPSNLKCRGVREVTLCSVLLSNSPGFNRLDWWQKRVKLEEVEFSRDYGYQNQIGNVECVWRREVPYDPADREDAKFFSNDQN
jgi:hypothetical protein